MVEGPEDDPLDRVVQVRVRVDDDSGVAAQFQDHLLLTGLGFQVPTDAGRPGEAEQLQPFIRGEQVRPVAGCGKDRKGPLR